MELLLLGNKLLSIKGHSRELGASKIPSEDSDVGTHTSGAGELIVGLEGSRESLVPIQLALSMELRQLVKELSSCVLRSSMAPGHIGHTLYLVYTLEMAENLEPSP